MLRVVGAALIDKPSPRDVEVGFKFSLCYLASLRAAWET